MTNFSQGLWHLNTQFPVGSTLWGDLGSVVLLEEVRHLGVGFEVPEALHYSQGASLSDSSFWFRMRALSILVQLHAGRLPLPCPYGF